MTTQVVVELASDGILALVGVGLVLMAVVTIKSLVEKKKRGKKK